MQKRKILVINKNGKNAFEVISGVDAEKYFVLTDSGRPGGCLAQRAGEAVLAKGRKPGLEAGRKLKLFFGTNAIEELDKRELKIGENKWQKHM